jgi:rod shape-determining protein MreB
VDIGGGKTEVGVVSMGGLVVGRGMIVAGNDLDKSLVNYVRMRHNMMIGLSSAEKIKIGIGNVNTDIDGKKVPC